MSIKDIALYTGLALLAGFILVLFLVINVGLNIGARIYDLFSRKKDY